MLASQVRGSLNQKVSAPYTIEPISTEEALSVLEADWNRLSETAECPNVFTTYGWFRAWISRLVAEDCRARYQPHVLLLKQSGAVVGIAPFIQHISSRFGFRMRKLEFVTNHADYNDVVLGGDPAGQIEAVIDFLARTPEQWDVVDLRDLRDTGHSIERIKHALARAGLSHRFVPELARCPYMLIDGPASKMMKQHSRSTRRVYRRFTEMLNEGLKVRVVENPHQEPGLLERLIALEARKCVGGKLSLPLIGEYPEVFQSLFDTLGPRGWISVVLLEWKDRLVAWQLLYRCGKKLWGYSTAYDHDFSSLSPGAILVLAMVDYSFARGIEEFDFLRGEETYKMRWATGFHHACRLLIWNRRWMSQLRAFAYFNLRVRSSAPPKAEPPAVTA